MLLLGLVTAAVLLRLPLLIPTVIDWDESLYMLIVEAWRAGGLPYETIWDHKPIGTYVLFGLVEALFGPGFAPIRLFGSVLVGVSAYLIARLLPVVAGHDDAETRRLGLLAGLAYVLFCFVDQGLATNTELMFTPFVVGAALLVLRAGAAPSRTRIIAIGLLMGAALQIKYVVAVELALFAHILLSRMPRPRRLAAALLLIVAAGLPTALTLGYFAAHGKATLWFDSTVLANLRHTGMIAPASIALKLALWALLHAPFVLALARLVTRREARIVVLWTAAAAVGVIGTGRFYQHYFLEMLPPLCLALALAIRGLGSARAVRVAVLSLAVASPLTLIPLVGPIQAVAEHGVRAALEGTDLPARIARRIDALAPAGAPPTLYVFDYEPVLYLLLKTTPPGRYIFPPILTRAHFTHVADIDPVAELEANMVGRPAFVVKRDRRDDTLTNDSHNDAVYARFASILAADYLKVDTHEHVEIWRRRAPDAHDEAPP
jgi:hypothetical protein